MTLRNRQRRRTTDAEESRCRWKVVEGWGGWRSTGVEVIVHLQSRRKYLAVTARAILSSKLSKQPPGVLYWHSLSWLLADYTHTHTHPKPTRARERIHFNTDTRFLLRARIAGPLRPYIYARKPLLSYSRRPSGSRQHVHVSSFSFFLETCLFFRIP